MSKVANDITASGVRFGLPLAIGAAFAFGMSGAWARGLIDAGWTPGAAVTARVWVAALVLLVPTILSLRGRWGVLKKNAGMVAAYGLLAVTATQLCYFQAVAVMDVGLALLIEYTAPIAVILWLWLRRGERPSRRSVIGAAIAFVGLVLMLDIITGAEVNVAGILWALAAMVGAATYFLLSAKADTGLPPIALAGGGLLLGAVALTIAGLIGILPLAWTTDDITYRFGTVPWFVPVLAIGLIATALAYVLGIASTRMLGSRLASFVALSEVVAALLFGWLLLGQLPDLLQALGGALVLVGVVVVKLGEPRPAEFVEPIPDAVALPPR
ncbi:drug/metabolite transporter (DMT)-like permease [Microbacterium phyllosphaerae]|uniref:Drug/metabolite transporter (DMT)-like permease n=1 Tax=Microbacterium phyllosphaerae TaxID=124798 RepID=A0ABS4WK31_9MICO|nr:EamA family transporter [Microbacterium phyllosphaerae]MBP2376565.1 drug/metabolite transporter (DMT)-like permease [Microbacterium phyllosphaerae]